MARYFITEKCVGCGGCRSMCPEHCITGDRPPMCIQQEKCTLCGKCAAACPRRAIVKL